MINREKINREKNGLPSGKVWLVGAGPSDVELLTLKGKRLLNEAEVIVYDRLAGQGILMFGSPDAEYIDVGKRAGHHPIPQQEINRILLEKAGEGKRVVRIKGGDPFVFGRGAEEAEELAAAGIPFEIVPGITSATAVPAYQGIPVTHRDMASSVHIITAHKKDGGMPKEQYEVLAKTEGTLVFLMGVTALPELMDGLIQAGMDPARPAAVLERGTTAGQRKTAATVGTLADCAKKAGIKPPAIIMVGEVCSLTELAWYDKRPLAGKKILVTRPRERSGKLAGMLREQGAEVLEIPSIRTEELPDQTRFFEAVEELRQYDWLLLTSPAGAEIFFRLLGKVRMDLRKMAHLKIACIGPGTAAVLEQRGIYADLLPEVYDGVHLGRAVGKALKEGEKVLLPRAKNGTPELIEEMNQAYHGEGSPAVTEICIYEALPEKVPYFDYKSEMEKGSIDSVMFTSASTVRGLVQAAGEMDYSGIRALCIGKQTETEALKHGMQTAVAKEATLQALVELAQTQH